jgi:hypothetical protein
MNHHRAARGAGIAVRRSPLAILVTGTPIRADVSYANVTVLSAYFGETGLVDATGEGDA